MHKGAQWVEGTGPISALAAAVRTARVGVISIGKNARLIGVVTGRDIVIRAVARRKDLSHRTAADGMPKGIVWCRDEDGADVVRVRQQKRSCDLPVLDGTRRLPGLLRRGDATRVFGGAPAAVAARHV